MGLFFDLDDSKIFRAIWFFGLIKFTIIQYSNAIHFQKNEGGEIFRLANID